MWPSLLFVWVYKGSWILMILLCIRLSQLSLQRMSCPSLWSLSQSASDISQLRVPVSSRWHLPFDLLLIDFKINLPYNFFFYHSQEKQKHEAGTDLWKLWSRKTNQWFSLMPDWIVSSFFKMKFIQYLGIWNPIKRTDTLPPMSS